MVRREKKTLFSSNVLRISSIVLFIAAWQVVGMNVNPIFLSTPIQVFTAFFQLVSTGELQSGLLSTLYVLLVGFAISQVLGIAFGFLVGRYDRLYQFTEVMFTVFYGMPYIALIPLFILWFGLGINVKIWITAFSAFFPTAINAREAVRNVDRSLNDMVLTFGADEREVFTKLVLPSSIPFITAGMRIAIGRALVSVVVAEILTAVSGLGGLMQYYGNFFQTAKMLAPLIILAFMGLGLTFATKYLEDRFQSWKARE